MERRDHSPYHDLEHSKRQFRLLRLLSSNAGNIQCELRIVSLLDDDLPPWKALSYRWGEESLEFLVHLNDHRLNIRSNLHTIMTQMVAEKRKEWFFIDALCIDQDNEMEKPIQVAIMGEIYQRAEEVVAWIVHDPNQCNVSTNRTTDDTTGGSVHIVSASRAHLEKVVLENSYWSRLWIVQEVLLAKRLTIRIGSDEIEWSNILPEKDLFGRRGLPLQNICLSTQQSETEAHRNKAIHILSHRRFEYKSLRAGKRLPFHKTFEFFALQSCGRVHDKIFGYLGLTNSRIEIDYSLSILDLFTATLGDYLLSAGLITEDLTPIRRKIDVCRIVGSVINAKGLIAPLRAFDLDPNDPVVDVLFYEVIKYFAPGYEDCLHDHAVVEWLHGQSDFHRRFRDTAGGADEPIELRQIGSILIKRFKLAYHEGLDNRPILKALNVRRKALAEQDAVLTNAENGESKKHSEWAAHARAISDQMWRRYQESGEDIDGDLDDESWILVA